jgi:hypothetical protein
VAGVTALEAWRLRDVRTRMRTGGPPMSVPSELAG